MPDQFSLFEAEVEQPPPRGRDARFSARKGELFPAGRERMESFGATAVLVSNDSGTPVEIEDPPELVDAIVAIEHDTGTESFSKGSLDLDEPCNTINVGVNSVDSLHWRVETTKVSSTELTPTFPEEPDLPIDRSAVGTAWIKFLNLREDETAAAWLEEFPPLTFPPDECAEAEGLALAGPPNPVEFQAYDDNISTDYLCPKCAYKWSGGRYDDEGTEEEPEKKLVLAEDKPMVCPRCRHEWILERPPETMSLF